jgi:2-amino-4-hydroxy-6-hydroxymethyldihydropteridine diphosphokinase
VLRKAIYLLLGSNLDDREKNLLLAIKKINEQTGTVVKVSSLYSTQPWGVTDQPDFLNQVIEIESLYPPHDLLLQLLRIETEIGRKHVARWGPRVIDIDILFFGNEVDIGPNLVIPHPEMIHRRFTLIPLCEIAPRFVHPQLKKKCEQLLKECVDPSAVTLYTPTDS